MCCLKRSDLTWVFNPKLWTSSFEQTNSIWAHFLWECICCIVTHTTKHRGNFGSTETHNISCNYEQSTLAEKELGKQLASSLTFLKFQIYKRPCSQHVLLAALFALQIQCNTVNSTEQIVVFLSSRCVRLGDLFYRGPLSSGKVKVFVSFKTFSAA